MTGDYVSMPGEYLSSGARLGYGTRRRAAGCCAHPTPLDRDYWRPLTRELGDSRIIPDLRGHGARSWAWTADWRIYPCPRRAGADDGQLAADILALLDHLKISKAVFGGCSIGGYVMLELWRRAPQRMRG